MARRDDLVEHLGWDLWLATSRWKERFTAAMVDRGHGWYAEARGELFRHLDPGGVQQGVLAERAEMTKQAVQQLVDGLVRDGIVRRVADPEDARARVLYLTAKGVRAAEDARLIKRDIDAHYRSVLGAESLHTLQRLLRTLIASGEHHAAQRP